MGTVAVVGSINQDLLITVEHLPHPGETILSTSEKRAFGGKGANQAVAVAWAQGDALMVGAVGDDGEPLLANLREAGVNTSGVADLRGVPSGVAVCLTDAAGESAIIVSSGANYRVEPQLVADALAEQPDVAVVLAQCEIPPAAVEEAARAAERVGARFVLNLAPYREEPEAVIRACDPLVVNEVEAQALLASHGRTVEDLANAEAVAEEFAGVAKSVVVTLGSQGSVWVDDTGSGHVPAERVDVVDSTGAGDSFVGALAAELAAGRDLRSAVAVGSRAGAAAVQRWGAQLTR